MRASHPAAPHPAAEWRSPFAAMLGRWRHMSPLARDVTVVLALKAVVLSLLWFAFFRTPAAPHMTMDPQRVVEST